MVGEEVWNVRDELAGVELRREKRQRAQVARSKGLEGPGGMSTKCSRGDESVDGLCWCKIVSSREM